MRFLGDGLRILLHSVIAGGLLMLVAIGNGNAASQDECAIWLCLPGGFGPGCGGAKSAFKRRVKKHRPPLPPFSQCAQSSEGMSYSQGHEPYYCARAGWRLGSVGGGQDEQQTVVCLSGQVACQIEDPRDPPVCRAEQVPAVRRAKPNWIQLYQEGRPLGKRSWY